MVSGEIHNEGKIKTMTISTKWTWINFILSIIGSVSGYCAYALKIGKFGRNGFIAALLFSFLPTFVPAAMNVRIAGD